MTSFFAASLMLSRWKLLIMPSVSSNWCSRRAIISWRYLPFLTISAWVFLTASSLVGSTLPQLLDNSLGQLKSSVKLIPDCIVSLPLSLKIILSSERRKVIHLRC